MMTVMLALRADDAGRLVASLDGQVLSATPLDALPSLAMLQADAAHIGRRLMDALGGASLVQRLENDAERLLLLDCDARADAIAWEFAALDDDTFLAVRFGLLRVLNTSALPAPANAPLNFVFLGADPLVDQSGNPREGHRLGIEKEWRDIHRTLRNSGIALDAQRVPPTERKLQDALRRGPAILHLTCHGSIIHTADGAMAVLHLEDENGKDAPLRGNLLATMPPRGVLRLVLLSACHTAEGRDSDIARLLVTSGVPFAIGMQGEFVDALSEPFAVALYDTLLAGQSLAEALRQARQAIANHPAQVGLPVGYTAREAWGALPLTRGQPIVGSLGLPGKVQLASEVQPPRPLLGRNRELHALAQTYAQGHRVVTIKGTGGIGKTALAASFAERFAWRWAEGVRSVSFASDVVDAQMFRLALLRELLGEPRAQQFADADAETQTCEILRFLRDWDGLLLIDNYESVLQLFETTADGRPPTADSQAAAVHRLVAQMAEGGASLLLTSRQNPAGLCGEVVFPHSDEPLSGLALQAGAALFYQHSAKAKGQWDSETVRQLAQEIARVTEGHPLAIALLAGEFDTSDVSPADFLKNWENELADARRLGMAPHHITFAAAFERSYNRLTPEQQKRLRALSVFAFPFYAWGAIVWTEDEGRRTEDEGRRMEDEGWLAQVRERLGEFTRRNLLEIDGWFKDGTPAAYRFQPALRQEVARRLSAEERAALMPAYAAYAYWFVDMARDAITREPAVARRAQQAANELIALADAQPADRLAHYCWMLGEILQQFGRISDAEKILERGEASAKTQSDDVRLARILVVKANLAVIRGKLNDAMSLYDQAARLLKNREDKQGVGAVFHQMARIYETRGDLEGALRLYQQSLAIKEQLGNLQGKAATLHEIARVYVTRGELEGALRLYQQSLAIFEQLGDLQGKAVTLHAIASVYETRGELEGALRLYQQSLAIAEQLGNLQGKAATLSGMGNIHAAKGNFDEAEKFFGESLKLNQQLAQPEGIAFTTVQLGQVAQARGDRETALARYREGLALFERLGMPRETAQVRELIARLERTTADQQPLTEGEMDAELRAQLDALSPEQRAQLEEALRAFARMSPEEQAAAVAQMERAQIQFLADQVRDAAMAVRRGEVPREEVLPQLEQLAARIEREQPPDSPWGELAAFIRAVIVLLRGRAPRILVPGQREEPLPPVPAAYAGYLAAIQNT